MGSIDVRSQWDQIQSSEKQKPTVVQLPEGEYQVIIGSLKFFEANEKLPACLNMKLQVAAREYKGKSINYNNYLNSRKSIVFFRTAVNKLIPTAFEMNFDEVLSSLKAISEAKKVIRVQLSYNSNGNGKQYTNVKFLGIEKKVEQPKPESVVSMQEPF